MTCGETAASESGSRTAGPTPPSPDRQRRGLLDEIALGRYLPGDSDLHRAAPAWKATIFATAALLSFLFDSAVSFVILGAVLSLLAARGGLPQRRLWRSLRPVTLLGWCALLTWAFFNHGQSSWDQIVFVWDGLKTGGLYAARLFVITLLTTLFFYTTPPQPAIRLGVTCLSPLRLTGVDRKELSLLVHLAYRFLPLLANETREMQSGRIARGLPEPKGLWARLQDAHDRLIALLLNALERAEIAALTLEQRNVIERWEGTSEAGPTGWGGLSLTLLALSLPLAWLANGWGW